MDAICGTGPDATGVVEAETIEPTIGWFGEDIAAGEGSVVLNIEDAHVAVGVTGVGDVELFFIRGKGEAIRADEAVGGDRDFGGGGIDAKDVAGADFTLGLVSFVVGIDAIGGVGEPDRVVGPDDDVVRRIEAFALEAIGEHGDRAIEFGSGDAAIAVFAGYEATLAIDRIAIGVTGGVSEDAGNTVGFVPLHHAVVGDVAPDDVSMGREVGWSLGPAAAFGELFDSGASFDALVEAWIDGDEGAGGHAVSFDDGCR